MSHSVTIFEYDKLIADDNVDGCISISSLAFAELQARLEIDNTHECKWLRLRSVRHKPVLQITGYAGVLCTSDGTQIEVLPKLGRKLETHEQSRCILLRMVKALLDCPWYESEDARLNITQMPLLEIFIHKFLLATRDVVRRGIRNQYVSQQDNLLALRGKLMVSSHIAANLFRPERFYTEHDEFLSDRPENRLIHSALSRVKHLAQRIDNQRLARELAFVFAEVPQSQNIDKDLQSKNLDRGMHYYQSALAWAELILKGYSPLTGIGKTHAPSLMFPMPKLFEAYVAKTLPVQLARECRLQTQVKTEYLVEHQQQRWMQLKPDLLVQKMGHNVMVLDTKWKLLDQSKTNSKDKYGISQSDFYQLYAYGKYYLNGKGGLILIYPRTDYFNQPLPVFNFVDIDEESKLKLWVLPYILDETTGYPLINQPNQDGLEYILPES